MAKKKYFSKEDEIPSGDDGRMAKVIISTKLGNNKYAYKESIVSQNEVQNYIKENKS